MLFNKIKSALMLVGLLAAGALSATAASGDPVTIPTPPDTFIDWNYCSFNGGAGGIENNGANIGSTGSNTHVTFNLVSQQAAAYNLTITTGHKGTAYMDIAIKDASGNTKFTATHKIVNTGNWTPTASSTFSVPELPAGNYVLDLKARDLEGSNYAGNWGKLALYDANFDNTEHVPGTISIAKSTLFGGARNEGQNIGYVTNGCGGTNEITVDEAGVYALTIPMTRYSDGVINVTVTDPVKGVEAETHCPMPAKSDNYAPQTINIEGELTTGKKTFKLLFTNSGGFICNYKDMQMTKIGEQCATFTGVSIDGQSITAGEGCDWNCNLPLSFTDATTTVKVNANARAHVSATAVDGNGNAVTVTDNGNGTFSLPTPAGNGEAVITFNVSADQGVMVFRDSYTLRIYHIGDIIINALTIDDVKAPEALVEALNVAGDNVSAELNDWIFTSDPVISARFTDGSTATATGSFTGTNGVFTLKCTVGSRTKTYTIHINGYHGYTPGDNDEMVKIVYDPGLNKTDGSWSNGSYSLNPANDGWGGSQFKFWTNTEITLSIPSNIVIKQIKFARIKDNYSPGSIGYVTSEGAENIYLPTASAFLNGNGVEKDIYVNFDGHVAGTPVKFLFNPGNQPVAWFEIMTETITLTSAPTVKSVVSTSTEHTDHAVVTFTFDREMQSASATVAGATLQGEVSGSNIRFSAWDLPYNTTTQLVIPAGSAKDLFGNTNDVEIKFDLVVGAPAEVGAIEPIVVTNVNEWKEAFASLAQTNTALDAPRAVIFVTNGDYDFGAEEQTIRVNNVSIIGESKEGVLLHGSRTGISLPVISTRNATGTYFQDLTIRNDLDFGKENRVGVGVALYGGDKDALVNVALQSVQDTYVTGKQGYMKNCDIHGSVDFICGGGDHYFDHCNLINEFADGYVTAPSTSANNKYGYVFESCTITGASPYYLARPWQQEPRCYYLNTKMNALPAPEGWAAMSEPMPTHFYEYNSVDKDGNLIDLTTRRNAGTSTNSYSPILTADEAAAFTVRNVLCGTDSWDPSTDAAACEAPANVKLTSNVLTWNPVSGASSYAVFKNGEYLAHVSGTTLDMGSPLSWRAASDDADGYTVRAANAMGGLGETSAEVKDIETGLDNIAADGMITSTTYFNLQGIEVAPDAKGIVIRVDRLADGSITATKEIR